MIKNINMFDALMPIIKFEFSTDEINITAEF